MLPQALSFIDIETTGTHPSYDRVIEIGILRVENNKLVEKYSTLINPLSHISPFIENLTGISQKEVDNAPVFWEVKEKVEELLKDSLFVAHNARFDYGFLRNEMKRCDTAFSTKQLCTVKLSRALFPRYKKHDLDSIVERFSLVYKVRHRAFDDAKILWDFFKLLKKQYGEEKLSVYIAKVLKRPSRPIAISEKELDKLPESPGVYMFYGKNDALLYIGKSVNIRDRVLSHFASDSLSSTEMQISQEIKRIETISTAGELGALFKESALIKQLQPHYNKALREKHKITVLHKTTTPDGYDSVSIDTIPQITTDEFTQIYGIFKSKKQAQTTLVDLAKEYNLCQRILGVEHTNVSCFGYRLGWCKGACVKKEKPLGYNIRFLQAFSKYKIKTWPFDGPIVIEEKDELTEIYEGFVIDKWCCVGTITRKDGQEEVNSFNDYAFDADMYKILLSYLKTESNTKKIRLFPKEELQFSKL